MQKRPIVLAILDGWGIAPHASNNAIFRAKTPYYDSFVKNYFTTTIQAAGEAVGLKWGEVGNSEVGHLNIGAGKVIFQPQPRIDKAIIEGGFFDNEEFLKLTQGLKKEGKALHLLGLVSDTGVHSTIEHLYALLELAKQQELEKVFIHAILDGRDAPYSSGLRYIEKLQAKIKEIGIGKIATISGRFWSMDRNNNWDRTEKAFQAMVNGVADQFFTDPIVAVRASYQNNVFDEEFVPSVGINEQKEPIGKVENGDGVIFFNFRADRARQLTRALVERPFEEFDTSPLGDIHMVTLTEYQSGLPVAVAFPTANVENPLAKVVSDAGLRQLHVAETEKYAHVTYFLNGGREEPFPGEDRELVPSPPVTSYEEKPEMSALEIREKVVHAVESGYDLVIVNFANADMVGHTGNMEATRQAVEVLDLCLGTIAKTVLEKEGILIITADHGNAERMIDQNTGDIDKEHTSLAVPFIVIGEEFMRTQPLTDLPDLSNAPAGGLLSDVAPTILKLMELEPPKEMSGRSLI